jgi:hypothetical protein
MAQLERGAKADPNRRQFLLFALAASNEANRSLLVRQEGENLRVSAPQIRFLTGQPLQQLRSGLNVGFLSQLTMLQESQSLDVLSRSIERFVVSFDLWEEKFKATRLGPPRRTQSRLTAPACEAWCLDQLLAIPPGLAPQRRFWLRLELRAEDARDLPPVVSEPGINITRLIEIFSRPPRNKETRWQAAAGPLRLEDLEAGRSAK